MDKIIVIFILLLISSLFISFIFIKDNFKAVIVSSILSLIYVIFHTYLLALDVAMTEIVIGISVSTIILLFSLKIINDISYIFVFKDNIFTFCLMVILFCIILFYIQETPILWDKNEVVHGYVSEFYIEKTKENFGFKNIVTAILAGFRGFDTFGETIVVFVAGISILLFLQEDIDE